MNEPKVWLTGAWQQRALDAMNDTLNVHADLKREMVEFLLRSGFWDEKSLTWDAAVTKFNACLRPAYARENFTNLQLWALIKQFDRHAWFLAMADDLGYEVRRKPTEERRIEATERLAAALEQANKIALAAQSDLAAIDETPPRVHRAVREGVGSFSLPDREDGDDSAVPSL